MNFQISTLFSLFVTITLHCTCLQPGRVPVKAALAALAPARRAVVPGARRVSHAPHVHLGAGIETDFRITSIYVKKIGLSIKVKEYVYKVLGLSVTRSVGLSDT